MSAYIINDENYHFLLSYLREEQSRYPFYLYTNIGDGFEHIAFQRHNEKHDLRKCESVMQILIDQNYKSINYRYQDNEEFEKEEPHTYIFDTDFHYERHLKKENIRGQVVNINKFGAILSMLDCYEYQACENPGYYESQACQIVNSLRKHIIRKTSVYEGIDGWFSL